MKGKTKETLKQRTFYVTLCCKLKLPVNFFVDFYRAALNAGRSSRNKGVRRSVFLPLCLSVRRADCDKTEGKYVQILYCTKDH